jgi:hypothetical protein
MSNFSNALERLVFHCNLSPGSMDALLDPLRPLLSVALGLNLYMSNSKSYFLTLFNPSPSCMGALIGSPLGTSLALEIVRI